MKKYNYISKDKCYSVESDEDNIYISRELFKYENMDNCLEFIKAMRDSRSVSKKYCNINLFALKYFTDAKDHARIIYKSRLIKRKSC